jgi:serine/threonine-protein kinase
MVIGVTLVTVTSRVIYGLRRQVREAQKLGQYTLLEKLGEGGMGQVFRARHAMLRRPTAVKLLHPERIGGPQDLARFEREVQLTAQLSHPNIVTVFDYGRTPDGVFYYAMELLDGRDLQEIVDETGPMSPARAVHILAQVARALADAHAVGLIHRDIKPANILLCARGAAFDVAKVVDFGLVKQVGSAPEHVSEDAPKSREPVRVPFGPSAGFAGPQVVDLSQPGSVVGTPLYLAPEALRDPSSLDGRADLYALGAVGYFLLTGTSVFGGTTIVEVCHHLLTSVPEPPSARLREIRHAASVPADLEDVVMRCLAKTPANRPASARALVDALEACDSFGEWTDADARAAWASHRSSSRRDGTATIDPIAKTEAVTVETTTAVSVVARQPPEPPLP